MTDNTNKGQRWYDKDPILKEALELLKLSTDEQKEQAKDFMLKLQEDVAQDVIERIYINFCNPWPKGKHRKKRLTHTRQLEKYKTFLAPRGEVYFKTDDIDLFNSSLLYFAEAGFEIIKQTNNLHKETDFWNNIETEHEKMFSEQGININALIAKRK